MKFLSVLLFLLPISLFCQFQDNFSDGNFNSNPPWIGNTDSFEIDTNEKLHLNAPANTAESFLSTASQGAINGFWEFYVKLDFNPSSSNKALVYLMSNNDNLKQALNGYFIMIGNTADEISLYRQDGTNTTNIIDGTDGLTNASVNEMKVKIDRDNLGNFELFVDTSSALNSYFSQGTAFDNTYMSSSYFGVFCDYTATRSDKFWFDDFNVTSQIYVDNSPPKLIAHSINSLQSVSFYFDEVLDSITAINNANYLLNSTLNPLSILYYGNELLLNFNQFFSTNNQITIHTEDESNNPLDTTFNFQVINTPFHNVIINEIYADETPSFGMPAFEFVELKNVSSDTIFLNNWKFADASDTVLIPYDTILPHNFLLLCKTTAESDYSLFGKTVGVPNFPSLNNSGDNLKIFNTYDVLIDSVSYKVDWYRNETDSVGNQKKNGGYSLERIFTDEICTPFYNWFPSFNTSGATPGTENSVVNYSFSSTPITIQDIIIDNDTTLLVSLNTEAQNIGTQNVNVLNNGVEQAYISSTNTLTVHLAQPLQTGQPYVLQLSNLQDCFNNVLPNTTDSFFLYQTPQKGDLIINEILFNPVSGGIDFLEIYNTQNTAFEVLGLEVLEYDGNNPQLLTDSLFIDKIRLMPGSYTVLTLDTALLQELHYVANPGWLYECRLPNFNDDKSIAVLKQKNGVWFDSLYYDKSWHFELLDVQDGVSLERIQATEPTNDKNNWHSAARTYNYATPTAQNSQAFNVNQADNISVEPEVFTPNEDGYNDFCLISYNNATVGEVADITVYDALGRKVKLLAQNQLLGTNNTWQWNGTNNNFEKADVGIYIIVFELFNESGKKKVIKKNVVLGTSLK
ncbi:MAG: lamin tail domain-containing protein [Chitinophagales bacterium]|nr:lamin tail domain-containing protein [Chitinophagales bacterium]